MTRAEIRIEAAKRRAKEAEVKWKAAWATKRAAVSKVEGAHMRRVWAADRKMREALQAVAIAELAALGITPMKTIILWHPKGYTAPSAHNRYAVRVTRDGWKRLVPVGKTGVILKGRNDVNGPYSDGWHKVTVTDQDVKE